VPMTMTRTSVASVRFCVVWLTLRLSAEDDEIYCCAVTSSNCPILWWGWSLLREVELGSGILRRQHMLSRSRAESAR
jgi:hypothetical protein